ncbi:MAG: glycosyltransferase, partial [Saprospiraceae bacterium]|nr:glycosyltransferase [Saprospiraceae bacterium]
MNAAGDRSQETEKHWPNIPIIVLNWNGLDDTRECMHALLQLDYPRFQVYLIDNGSVGREGAILESEFHSIAQITVLRLEANLGFTGAHNWILPRLLDEDYPYIALLNNDTVPDRHWLRELV